VGGGWLNCNCGEDWLRSGDVTGWVRQAERAQGLRFGPTSDDRERVKTLEREVREWRQANEILCKASAYCLSFPARSMNRLMGQGRKARQCRWRFPQQS
jgi:transposase-like protein